MYWLLGAKILLFLMRDCGIRVGISYICSMEETYKTIVFIGKMIILFRKLKWVHKQ